LLDEVAQGKAVSDVSSSPEVSEATYSIWTAKYAGMESGDVRRLGELEKENEALKLLLAKRHREVSAVRKIIRRDGW